MYVFNVVYFDFNAFYSEFDTIINFYQEFVYCGHITKFVVYTRVPFCDIYDIKELITESIYPESYSYP